MLPKKREFHYLGSIQLNKKSSTSLPLCLVSASSYSPIIVG